MSNVLPADPHPASQELAYLGLSELHERLFSGRLTSVELVEALIERARVINDEAGLGVNALIAIAPDALDQARQRDTERATLTYRSPLHGIPIAVKDNINVQGWPSAAGSLNFTGVATEDAAVIATLRAAGAIIYASANLSEWASAAHENIPAGWSSRGGLTRNPWWLDRAVGESSSGSAAAVAAGLVPIALGTETIGSLTMPASHCGVVSLKAARGVVSIEGLVPYSREQDVVGVLARSVGDAATVLSELGAHFPVVEDAPAIVFCEDEDFARRRRTEEILEAYRTLEAMLHSSVNTSTGPVPNTASSNWERAFAVLHGELQRDLPAYLRSRPDAIYSELKDFANGLPGTVMVAGEEPDYVKFAGDPVIFSNQRQEIESLFLKAVHQTLGQATVLAAVAYGPATKNDVVYLDAVGLGQYQSGLDGVSSFIGWPAVTLPLTLVRGLPVGLIMIAPPEHAGDLVEMAKRVERLLNPSASFQRPTFTVANGL